MKTWIHLIAMVALASAAATANAQFVKGNEAVKIMPDGSRKVETPPLPKATLAAPCSPAKPGCVAGAWRMVETSQGIQECTEIYARPGSCRASTYGAEKRSRIWIIKSAGKWLQCQRPSLKSKCVGMKDLPYSAVQ